MEGTSFAGDRAAVAAGAVTLRRLLGRLHQAGSAELGPLFGEIDQLEAVLGALKVVVLDQGCPAVMCGRRRGGCGSGGRPTAPVVRLHW